MNTDVLRLAEERDALAIAAIYAPSVTSSLTSFELVALIDARRRRCSAVRGAHTL